MKLLFQNDPSISSIPFGSFYIGIDAFLGFFGKKSPVGLNISDRGCGVTATWNAEQVIGSVYFSDFRQLVEYYEKQGEPIVIGVSPTGIDDYFKHRGYRVLHTVESQIPLVSIITFHFGGMVFHTVAAKFNEDGSLWVYDFPTATQNTPYYHKSLEAFLLKMRPSKSLCPRLIHICHIYH